jgi:ABC-type Fe3+-hydroxamate transport system substrate-binding protein
VEDVLAMDPDVIIFTAWGPFQNNYTQQQYAEFIDGMLQDYKTSSAYKSGQVYSISFEVYGTLPGISGIPYLGSQIWPNLFDEDEGVALLQEYFDKFTYISGRDVRTVPTLLPLTLAEIEGSVVPPMGTDTLLTVLGNADLDNDLDLGDVMAIEYLAGISAKVSDYPYADANNDGKITSNDAAYVQAIIDKNTTLASKIFYYNLNGDIASVSQPVTKIGADYWPCMDGIVVLGAQDILTHVDSGIYGQLSSNANKYNGFGQDKVVNFGSGFGSNYDFETVVATGVDAMVCGSKDIYFVGIEDRFTSLSSIDMIRLPFWEGDDVDSAVITLAYLLNNDKYIANAQKFLSFEKKVTDALDAGLSKVADKKSCLVVYIGNATDKSLDVEIEARGCGSFEWSVIGGMDNLSSDINTEGALESASMYYQTDQDYVISKNPDYVFILGKAGYNRTAADAQSSFNAGAAYLTTTKAYQNNNIWVCGSGLASGTMQKTMALMLACQVYGSEFSDVDPYDVLQEFVDTFTLTNNGVAPGSSGYFDVEDRGIWIYHPTN